MIREVDSSYVDITGSWAQCVLSYKRSLIFAAAWHCVALMSALIYWLVAFCKATPGNHTELFSMHGIG